MLSEKKNTTIVSTIFSYIPMYKTLCTYARAEEVRVQLRTVYIVVIIVRISVYLCIHTHIISRTYRC